MELSQRQSYSSLDDDDVITNEGRLIVSLDWNFFQGWSHQAGIDKLKQQMQRLQHQYQIQQLSLYDQSLQTQSSIQSAEQQLQSLQRVLIARQRAVEAIDKSWKLNLVGIVDVQKENNALASVMLDIYLQQRQLDFERLKLLYLQGELGQKTALSRVD